MEASYSFNALDPICPPLTDIPTPDQTYIGVYQQDPQGRSRSIRVRHVNTLHLLYSSTQTRDQATENTFLTFQIITMHF